MKKIIIIFGIIIATIIGCVSKCHADYYVIDGELWRCFDLEIIYARGSGQEYLESQEYKILLNESKKITDQYRLSTYTQDLNYPAVDVSSPVRLFGAYVSAGKAFSFGESVNVGVENLRNRLIKRHSECPEMHFALVGYSQGAMVVSRGVDAIDSSLIEFIMLLGDPNTYLPEGAGLFPSACFGGFHSPWRTFAPNCRTHEGVFGGRRPYELESLSGKYSLWCNRNDYICGSSHNPFVNSGHTQYVSLGELSWGVSYLAKKYLKVNQAEAAKPIFMSLKSVQRSIFDETSLSLIADDDISPVFPSPDNVEVWREDNNDLKVRINDMPKNAKYLLLRINNYDLGYIEPDSEDWTIYDIKSDDFELSMIWMREDGQLGEIRRIGFGAMADVEEPPDDDLIVAYGDTPDDVIGGASDETEPSNKDSPDYYSSNGAMNDNRAVSRTEIDAKNNSEAEERLMDEKSTTGNSVKGIEIAQERNELPRVAICIIGACGLLLAFIIRRRKVG